MLLRKCVPAHWLFCALWLFAANVRAQGDVTPDTTRDTLVYKDGDRVHGHVVEQANGVIVFKSERFGELRVPAADAVVIKAEKTPAMAAAEAAKREEAAPPTTAEREEQERVRIWDRFSPAVLTAAVREFFGPWHGRLSFSNELVTDTRTRNNLALEGKIFRKFEKDTVDLTARYDFNKTDELVTTDQFKAIGSWRHGFKRRAFAQYRPTLESNKANRVRQGLPYDYLMLQQEIGLGYNVYNRPAQKVRVGVSQNLFDVWSSVGGTSHTSHGVISLFDEVELALPWRMTLTQRGVWYPSAQQGQGWEDQIDLNKKLTETLSVSLRHEIRENSPDAALQDYTRLRLLLGLDF